MDACMYVYVCMYVCCIYVRYSMVIARCGYDEWVW